MIDIYGDGRIVAIWITASASPALRNRRLSAARRRRFAALHADARGRAFHRRCLKRPARMDERSALSDHNRCRSTGAGFPAAAGRCDARSGSGAGARRVRKTPPAPLPAPALPERAGVDPLVAARAAGVMFEARGEGFTLARFRDQHFLVRWDGRERAFFDPTPETPAYRGEIFNAQDSDGRLRVEIRTGPCPDAQSGETWSAHVLVRLDDETRRGCGRPL